MLPFDFIMYNIFDNYFGLFLGSLWNSADTMTSEWTIQGKHQCAKKVMFDLFAFLTCPGK